MAVREEGKLIFAANLGRYSNRNQRWWFGSRESRFLCLPDNQTIATRLQATKMARRGDLASRLTIIRTVEQSAASTSPAFSLAWPFSLRLAFPTHPLSLFLKITCATEIKVPRSTYPSPLMIPLIHPEKNTPSNLDCSSHCAATAVCRAKTHTCPINT